MMKEEMKEEVEEVEERVITMEEDGRLGNLLMEMATLLLIGRQANVTVSLLPQVAHIWLSQFLDALASLESKLMVIDGSGYGH